MRKNFKRYALCWLICLIIFHVLCFVSINYMAPSKYNAISFWVSYALIDCAFIAQLVCAFIAFEEKNAQKLFYRLTLVRASYTGLILSFIFGGACIIIPVLPYWLSSLVCIIVLLFNVFALAKANFAVSYVENIDRQVKNDSAFIKKMTAEANSLLLQASSQENRILYTKVYEAFRYSDPISKSELKTIEEKIAATFAIFQNTIVQNNDAATSQAFTDLINLINQRNTICKSLK